MNQILFVRGTYTSRIGMKVPEVTKTLLGLVRFFEPESNVRIHSLDGRRRFKVVMKALYKLIRFGGASSMLSSAVFAGCSEGERGRMSANRVVLKFGGITNGQCVNGPCFMVDRSNPLPVKTKPGSRPLKEILSSRTALLAPFQPRITCPFQGPNT